MRPGSNAGAWSSIDASNMRALPLRRACAYTLPNGPPLRSSIRQHADRGAATGETGQQDFRDDDNMTATTRVNFKSPLSPKPELYVQQSTQARHILRAILRECTYLPDPFARQWLSQHAVSHFRKYSFKVWNARKKGTIDIDARVTAKLVEARKIVGQLRRANEGERKILLKVMLMAYGRVGKRRHELMKPLLAAKGVRGRHEGVTSPISPEYLSSLEAMKSLSDDEAMVGEKMDAIKRGAKDTIDPSLTPQLRALLTSQKHVSPPTLTRPNPRSLKADIPETNAWLRPMPQSRIRNMKKKHYGELLDRTLPPLPSEEWSRLRDLATGHAEIKRAPLRRRRQASGFGGSVPKSALEMVVLYGKAPERAAFGNREAHVITSRFMQRLYAQVFSQCPSMDWDVDKKQWTVMWGGRGLYSAKSVVDASAGSGGNFGKGDSVKIAKTAEQFRAEAAMNQSTKSMFDNS